MEDSPNTNIGTSEPSNASSPKSKDAEHSDVLSMDTNIPLLQAPYNPEINNSNNITLCEESTVRNNTNVDDIKSNSPLVNIKNAISIASISSQLLLSGKKTFHVYQ